MEILPILDRLVTLANMRAIASEEMVSIIQRCMQESVGAQQAGGQSASSPHQERITKIKKDLQKRVINVWTLHVLSMHDPVVYIKK